MINYNNNLKGAILVELLFVMAIFVITIVSLFSIMNLSLKTAGNTRWDIQANLLAQEAMAGIRNIRDRTDWSTDGLGTVTNGAVYHLTQSGDPIVWNLTAGSGSIDNFTQSIVFEDALRDGNQNIAEIGVADTGTKIVTVTISWQSGTQTKEIIISGVFADWVKNN